jgi:EAL domain-containing protein (putative c-di-GMP-specific phosphodiesterase class I)
VDILLETGRADRLAVEITEHEEIDADGSLVDAAAALRTHGVLIVLDDIGTGYAGLDLLLHLRPDVIKLDGYIVRGMGTDPAHRAVAAGVTSIAKDLASRVVAEGIETSSDLAAARAAGINHGQGYLLGRPTPDLHTACENRAPLVASPGGPDPDRPRAHHGRGHIARSESRSH